MKIFNLIFLLFFLSFKAYTQKSPKGSENILSASDTSKVIELNNRAFNNRLINPEQTLADANLALKLASKLSYINGVAESYRVIGVGNYYMNFIDASIENYLMALSYFKQGKNLEGEARVYNNIGNLYRDIDYQKSLDNFNKSLLIAKKLGIRDLIAGLHLNIGTINQRKKNYPTALTQYKESLAMFKILNNTVGIIQSEQNLGLIYLNLGQLDTAEIYLLDAQQKARENKLNNSIASIGLTLSSIYITQEKFNEAEKTIKEGLAYAKMVKDSKIEYNYNLTSFDLENKRQNYKQALKYLQKAYKQDSLTYKSNVSDKISLLEAQHRQLEMQKENELTIARQKYTQIMIIAISSITLLAFVVIYLLVKYVRKSTMTNKELTRLNQEVSKQKDDLDRTNQNLEEIIEARTKELKNKNTKLSEYSSHLSHQIRSPVATLKGLMLLETDKLIDQNEFVEQMGKCINDLDDKIININENLNNPSKSSLVDED